MLSLHQGCVQRTPWAVHTSRRGGPLLGWLRTGRAGHCGSLRLVPDQRVKPTRRGRAATRRSLHTGLTARTTGIAKVKRSATIGGAMPLRAIAYVSEASRNLTEPRLQQLVAEAVQFNESVDVTGTLLFDGSRFLQYLEGPEAGINAAYTRILAAGSHSGIVELNRGRVGRRQFPHWRMRSVRVDELALGKIAISDWTGFVRSASALDSGSSALDRLLSVSPLQTDAGAGETLEPYRQSVR
ncbi:BLUF domain-containing protein [Stenotrophomonas maltophilia]|nr:BLUF domain-containing protein [Stenotrophomonas maltophilia]MCO7486302.1 BLUF domain-containing protein [Stenotrophomonas maltophilia]